MKRTAVSVLYVCSFAALVTVLWFVFSGSLSAGSDIAIPATVSPGAGPNVSSPANSFRHPHAIFILQLTLIIMVARICAWLFKKIGQPAVMGEIVAGILLGPSLLGLVMPSFSAFIFPASSLGNLQMLSQVGLILFMFVIGLELDLAMLKQKAGAAIFISYFSIVIPFIMGIGLAWYLYAGYAPANVPFYAFALFTGIAMSITAFPVLARIIKERGLSQTRLGTIAITAAAVGDVTAWSVLAFIIVIVHAGSLSSSFYILAAVIAYVLVLLFAVRPLLRMFLARLPDPSVMTRSSMAVIFVVLLFSSYCCEVLGIHALFGAFMAGIIMPQQMIFRRLLTDKIEDVALVLLLPLFFVFTGLRTQVALINDPALWTVFAAVVLVAVAGKFGGSAVAARFTGESVSDSLSIGALMNTRGLVELVVLNIGYDLKIITPQFFTIMVLMALVTTFMTNPALTLINRLYNKKV